MFVIDITYIKPLEVVDGLLEPHVAWLKQHFEAGLFLAAGRKEPRTGGVVIAVGDRDAVVAAVAGDPFGTERAASHLITEFHPTRTAPGFQEFLTGLS
jgi:uncharacterized protein YciI